MKEITSQILSLVSVVVIPFIPNDSLRSVALVLAPLFFAAYLAYHNTPNRQVARLDASMKDINALFEMTVHECGRDPRFVYEAGLKLTEINYAVSALRTRSISMKYISWKMYPYHLKGIASSIERCRREMEELRSSILLALEYARQQKYRADIDRRMAILASTFTPGRRARPAVLQARAPFVVESSGERAIVFECMNIEDREFGVL
ncbi:hypothetical protein B0H13DRAFT_2334203 [Mycena leptocephala]|nr:hypothetical protein B0H13DRAFT_2334203 [Mycena leptocephala]